LLSTILFGMGIYNDKNFLPFFFWRVSPLPFFRRRVFSSGYHFMWVTPCISFPALDASVPFHTSEDLLILEVELLQVFILDLYIPTFGWVSNFVLGLFIYFFWFGF